MKRCTKGKSCGATCITRPDRCVLELGPVISQSLTKARSKVGVVQLYYRVRDQKVKGGQAKFERIRKDLAGEIGGRINRTADLIELKNRLQKEGLIPKSKKSGDDLGAIFMKGIQAGKKTEPARPKFTPLPTDLKNQLAALPPPPEAPRQLSKSPGGARMRPPAATKEVFDDISRILRGSMPQNLQIASAGDEAGIRARIKPTEARQLEGYFRNLLGSKAGASMNLDQMREAAAREANSLSIRRENATNGQERKQLRSRIDRLQEAIAAADQLNASATGNTRWARVEAKDFDKMLATGVVQLKREGDVNYRGWDTSYGSGAQKIGEGAYGTVIRNPDGTFVKRGAISDTEAALIKRLGDADLGPRLKAADIDGPSPYHRENFVDVRNGRIAMGEVEGKPIGAGARADTQFGGKNAADIYWKAMADLHRMGIAHNDAHIDNILVDNKGKGRWVDLGLAQASPKAALAEAFGVFKPFKGGDDITVPSSAKGEGNWQTARWDGTGVRQAEGKKALGGQTWAEFKERFPVASRVWDNQAAAVRKLESFGLDVNDINSIVAHGIRSPMKSYDKSDGFSRITDKQAQEVLNTLYDGI